MTASGLEQVLIKDTIEPTAIAFSQDGRFLGVGCANGDIRILDMAKRSIYQTLMPTGFPCDKVVQLVSDKEGGWLAAYENGSIRRIHLDGI